MSNKPTILWIHGSWHTPAHMEPIISLAKTAGYVNECPRQPSVGNKPPVGMQDDAACIRNALERLVEQDGKDVVVVAHSYGGMLANESIGSRFSRRDRAAKGQAGGVVRIIFIAAFLVCEGEALVSQFGGALPPIIPTDDEGMCWMSEPRLVFYHDLSTAEQDKWTSELLKSPTSTQFTPLSQVAYPFHDLSFIHCSEDKGIGLDLQKDMVKKISDKYGVPFSTDVLPSSHSPFLSMPEKTLQAIERQIAA